VVERTRPSLSVTRTETSASGRILAKDNNQGSVKGDRAHCHLRARESADASRERVTNTRCIHQVADAHDERIAAISISGPSLVDAGMHHDFLPQLTFTAKTLRNREIHRMIHRKFFYSARKPYFSTRFFRMLHHRCFRRDIGCHFSQEDDLP
jgi:hypothetical protein